MGSSYFFLFHDHEAIVSSDVIDELQGEGWAMAAVTGCDMFDQDSQLIELKNLSFWSWKNIVYYNIRTR